MTTNAHLTESELFGLAVPAAGAPEALPAHLSDCLVCSRALQEWKAAVRELAVESDAPITRRTEGEWTAAENRTLDAIRSAGAPRRGSGLRWTVGIAASLLLFALALPFARWRPESLGAGRQHASELSAEDLKDDTLLRDVARLSRGEDAGSWTSLAPEPGAPAAGGEEDSL
ncbi:MAG: hypothetical protein ABI592_01080 [Acidobacteriota bacterium]